MIKVINVTAIKHKNGDPRKDLVINIDQEIENSELLEFERNKSKELKPQIVAKIGEKYDMHYLHQQR